MIKEKVGGTVYTFLLLWTPGCHAVSLLGPSILTDGFGKLLHTDKTAILNKATKISQKLFFSIHYSCSRS